MNRIRILKLLAHEKELPVKAISDKLDIRIKLTSQHLVLLSHARFVQGKGKLGSVYYMLHPKLRSEVQHILKKLIRE
ncbi:MAG: hypothetical protein A2W71_00960 [Candidatus Nealsonbacteria bacterium RIFCSPLOWO2_02_39_8]|nr:MAG: hypothetical protein A2W71_00960 [Candidatus Nealsonbacteria bacterium RIFCSPLOWO2_02_39_8]